MGTSRLRRNKKPGRPQKRQSAECEAPITQGVELLISLEDAKIYSNLQHMLGKTMFLEKSPCSKAALMILMNNFHAQDQHTLKGNQAFDRTNRNVGHE